MGREILSSLNSGSGRLVPNAHRFPAKSAQDFPADEVGLGIEGVVDGGVSFEEALG